MWREVYFHFVTWKKSIFSILGPSYSTIPREQRGTTTVPVLLYRPCHSLDFFMCKMGGESYICSGALSGQPGCWTIRSCCKKDYVDGDEPVTGCKECFQCCKVAVDTKVQGCKSRFDCCDGKVSYCSSERTKRASENAILHVGISFSLVHCTPMAHAMALSTMKILVVFHPN